MNLKLGMLERLALEGLGCAVFLLCAVAGATLVGWAALEWASH
jgi:hypothetical protein